VSQYQSNDDLLLQIAAHRETLKILKTVEPTLTTAPEIIRNAQAVTTTKRAIERLRGTIKMRQWEQEFRAFTEKHPELSGDELIKAHLSALEGERKKTDVTLSLLLHRERGGEATW
jgi:hypothetical protein